jgi:hypothetical protein
LHKQRNRERASARAARSIHPCGSGVKDEDVCLTPKKHFSPARSWRAPRSSGFGRERERERSQRQPEPRAERPTKQSSVALGRSTPREPPPDPSHRTARRVCNRAHLPSRVCNKVLALYTKVHPGFCCRWTESPQRGSVVCLCRPREFFQLVLRVNRAQVTQQPHCFSPQVRDSTFRLSFVRRKFVCLASTA